MLFFFVRMPYCCSICPVGLRVNVDNLSFSKSHVPRHCLSVNTLHVFLSLSAIWAGSRRGVRLAVHDAANGHRFIKTLKECTTSSAGSEMHETCIAPSGSKCRCLGWQVTPVMLRDGKSRVRMVGSVCVCLSV